MSSKVPTQKKLTDFFPTMIVEKTRLTKTIGVGDGNIVTCDFGVQCPSIHSQSPEQSQQSQQSEESTKDFFSEFLNLK